MDFKINNFVKTYGIDKTNKTWANTKTDNKTNVSSSALEISSSVLEYQSALSKVKDSADVRPEVVDKYKEMINNGSYNVSVSDLADKLLGL